MDKSPLSHFRFRAAKHWGGSTTALLLLLACQNSNDPNSGGSSTQAPASGGATGTTQVRATGGVLAAAGGTNASGVGGNNATGGISPSGGGAGGIAVQSTGGTPATSQTGGSSSTGGTGQFGGTSTGGNATGGATASRGGGSTAGGVSTTGGQTGGTNATSSGGAAGSVTNPAGGAGPNTNPGTVTQRGGIEFSKSGGWFEYAYAQWQAYAGATAYNAYYKLDSADDAAFVKIDAELIRGTRLDLPGLVGNSAYAIKVVPVVGQAEAVDRASVVRVTPMAHDRSGFAFDKRSPRTTQGTSGGYNPDGTVNSAASILYVTDANKDSVQLAVTKGKTTTTYTGLTAIMAARSSAKSTDPLVVRFIGSVNPPTGLDALKMLQLKDNTSVTYEGIGNDAEMNGWGFDFQRDSNIEIRNLAFKEQPEDQISFQSDCLNVWVHHVDHFRGKGLPDADADKAYGDGALDMKSGTSWVSVAYNYYHQYKKTGGLGFGDDTTALVMTFHHNFYDTCGSRMPRISYVSAHVYDTYFKGAETYAIAAANGCSAFVQNNYFENCKRPIIIASQGHDLTASGSTLSNNPGGAVKFVGNFLDAFSADPSQFDPAVDASPGPALVGGATYNDFDAKFGSDYPQAIDSPEVARVKVEQYSGRLKD